MAYFMIATIVDEQSNIMGYRVADTNQVDFRCTHVSYCDMGNKNIKERISSGLIIDNLHLKDGNLIPVGNIARYPKLSLSGELLSEPSYTVLMAHNSKVLLCDMYGNTRAINLVYLNGHKLKLTNAKLVMRKGTLVISSLSGSTLRGLEVNAGLKRKYKPMTYTPASNQDWRFNWYSETYKMPMEVKALISTTKAKQQAATPQQASKEPAVNINYNSQLTEVKSNDILSLESLLVEAGQYSSSYGAYGNSIYTNAKFLELLKLGKIPNKLSDFFCFSIDEYTDEQGERYLVFGGLLDIPLVVKDILHIGKGFIQIGVDNNKQSNDNTIICLGLLGLILIECKPEVNAQSKRYNIMEISRYCAIDCVPYNQLTTYGQIIKALNKLDSLDRNALSRLDGALILDAGKKCTNKLILHNDITKLSLSEKFSHNLYDDCKRRNAVISVSAAGVINPEYQITTNGVCSSDLHRSLLLEVYRSLTGSMYGYIAGSADTCPNLSRYEYIDSSQDTYSNLSGYGCVKDFGGHQIAAIPSYSLKRVGYVALLKSGKIDKVYPEMIPTEREVSDIMKMIHNTSINGNELMVQYGANQIIKYDLNKLLCMFQADKALIEKNSVLVDRFNAKHSLLGDGLRLDGIGYIVDYMDNARIRQSELIRGIDLNARENSRSKITVEVTDKFIVDRRFRSKPSESNSVSLVFDINTLDCIDKVEFSVEVISTSVDKLIFNLRGIDNSEDLERILLVYWFYKRKLPDEHKNKGIKFHLEHYGIHGGRLWSAGSPLQHGLKASFVTVVLENVTSVDSRLRLGLVRKMEAILGELKTEIRQRAKEFILDFVYDIIPDVDLKAKK